MKMATSRTAPFAVPAWRSYCVVTPAAAGKHCPGVVSQEYASILSLLWAFFQIFTTWALVI